MPTLIIHGDDDQIVPISASVAPCLRGEISAKTCAPCHKSQTTQTLQEIADPPMY